MFQNLRRGSRLYCCQRGETISEILFQFLESIPVHLAAEETGGAAEQLGVRRMITRSKLAEQLREYQSRSKHDWASVSLFSSTSSIASSRYFFCCLISTATWGFFCVQFEFFVLIFISAEDLPFTLLAV